MPLVLLGLLGCVIRCVRASHSQPTISLVGDYPRETPTPSLGTTNFAGVYQRFIKGRVRVG